jgi:hypothetical protein
MSTITKETDYVSEDSLVSHPGHYQSDDGIECIDAIRAMLGREQFIAYCRGSAMKYCWRHNRKTKDRRDLNKALQFLSFAITAEQEQQSE